MEEEKVLIQKKFVKISFHKNYNNSIPSKDKSSGTFFTIVHVKKLTSQEVREKREQGFCFYCNKKYSHGHHCKNQKIFRLEISEEIEDETY